MQRYETEQTIANSHPSLPGHFPGNPVVPGVVILDCVMQALAQWRDDVSVLEVPTAKFVSPLLPGQRLHITLEQKGEEVAAFTCRVEDRPVAQGKFRLQRKGL